MLMPEPGQRGTTPAHEMVEQNSPPTRSPPHALLMEDESGGEGRPPSLKCTGCPPRAPPPEVQGDLGAGWGIQLSSSNLRSF